MGKIIAWIVGNHVFNGDVVLEQHPQVEKLESLGTIKANGIVFYSCSDRLCGRIGHW